MAHAQLHLIHLDDELWKLDAQTIRVGRKGLARARAALADAARARTARAGEATPRPDRRTVLPDGAPRPGRSSPSAA